MRYGDFIQTKTRRLENFGFEPGTLPHKLFDWQSEVVRWAVARGRAALFCDCGMGKTAMQLAWAEQVVRHTGDPVMLHCPIGVRQQTIREAEKFGIEVPVNACDVQADVRDGITIANYEKLRHFEPDRFAGVVLDESSILKAFTGKTKRKLIASYRATPYRLACTATPAPNDQKELGNHAEFLGVMPSNEMLSRWFINDTMKAGGYRLKGHAADDFWRWMATWAVCMRRPSDLGDEFNDDGYELPELHRRDHVVESPEAPCSATGSLFGTTVLNATTTHSAKRQSCRDRAATVATIVSEKPNEPWIIWCDTNYEADELKIAIQAISDSVVEVRGSDLEQKKERRLLSFSTGEARIIITKPDIAGFGMNWQHCCNVAFVGLSYSYEKFYQAIRRSWRFGQTRPVNCHVITTDVESVIDETVDRKAVEHTAMQDAMAAAMRDAQIAEHRELSRVKYNPEQPLALPDFMGAK